MVRAKGILFFIGWILSPLTWWNDAFINIPLSYVMANLLAYIIPVPFLRLVIASYWFTNVAGLFFMYLGGKHLIASSKDRRKAILTMLIFMGIYALVMACMDKMGKLAPLCMFFEKYCVAK
ncbi:MAG: hypothetical protein KKG21_04085 [Candidatus Omnitrophica bacterium]|nr:hypothetical protein [Candidatus Omnitrophota bacterium]